MPMLSTAVLDAALDHLSTNATSLRICSGTESSTYATVNTNTLASATPSYGAAGTGSPSGRKKTVAAISSGTYSASGTATYIALVNTGATTVHATVALTTSKAVNSGDTINLGAFDVTITDPTAV
jgi:hypothetical protein